MSYDPLDVIAVLSSMAGVSTTVAEAVNARIAFEDAVELKNLLKIMEECGVTADQAMKVRKALKGDGPPAPPLRLASPVTSGAPVAVCVCLL